MKWKEKDRLMSIKQTIKNCLEQQQTSTYLKKLQAGRKTLEQWIIEKELEAESEFEEEKMRGKLTSNQEMTYAIIPYSECGQEFSLDKWKQDILIFVEDSKGLAKGAEKYIGQFFSRHPEIALVYGDADEKDNLSGQRSNLWFKPDWSPDTLFSYFYFAECFAVRRQKVEEILWKQSTNPLVNLYDFCLKTVESSTAFHIKRVLFHSEHLEPQGHQENFAEIKQAAAGRRGWDAFGEKLVSIIIPSKDNPEVLRTCLDSFCGKTDYPYEVIVVDNGSSLPNKALLEQMSTLYNFRYLYKPMEFNYPLMCNLGVAESKGELILLLNDDVEITDASWLRNLANTALRPHVGAVGAKLLYPDSDMIQHAGIVNIRMGPVHKLQFQRDSESHYFGYNCYSRNVLAVTGACLCIRKSVYLQSNGLNEVLRVAFNDVDFCYRLHEMGWFNVIRNDVILYHHESLSRGRDIDPVGAKRLQGEKEKLFELHPDLFNKDPFSHPFFGKDILDTNFSFAYEYEYQKNVQTSVPKLRRDRVKPEWENACLYTGIEFMDDFELWEKGIRGSSGYLYVQGWAFVTGSNNACYKKSLILERIKNQNGQRSEGTESELYEVALEDVYRPDIEKNIEGQTNVSMSGFSLKMSKSTLPEGTYRVAVSVKKQHAKEQLIRWVNSELVIENEK